MHGTMMMFLFAVPAVEAMGVSAAAQHAGGARPAVSEALRLCVLGLFRGRARVLLQHLLRRRARWRLVHVSAADELQVLARHQRRFLAARHRLHRDIGDRRRDRDRRRHPAHPRAGNDAWPHAGLCLVDAGLRGDDHLRLSGGDRLHPAAGTRARVRTGRSSFRSRAAIRCCGSICSGSSATRRSTSSSCPAPAWCR